MNKKPEDPLAELRKRAEERLREEYGPEGLVGETTLQDLRTHQIELEIQNQEFLETQIQLQALLTKYRDLYDRAPVGYLTLEGDGVIREANLSAADLLEIDRVQLIGTSLAQFVVPEDQDRFFQEVRRRLSSEGRYQSELRIRQGGSGFRWVSVEYSVEAVDEGEKLVSWCTLSDVTDRKVAETVLEESRDGLRKLGVRLQEVREKERTRLARELHDGVGQSLAALGMDLAWLKRELGPVPSEIEGLIDGMRSSVVNLIDEISEQMVSLRPPELDVFGVAEAIEHILTILGRRTEMEIFTDLSFEASDLGSESRTPVLRIFEEALSNVTRHAAAKSLTVRLWREGDELLLVVEDDGRGITDTAVWAEKSLGLIGMRERARAIGGEVLVEARPSGGTRVRARFPLPAEEASDEAPLMRPPRPPRV